MLKKSYKILSVFAKNPGKEYLFEEIKKITKSKSESYTYNNLQFFVNENIIKKEIKGGVSFYKALNSPKTISYLSITAEHNAWQKKNLPLRIIQELTNLIKIKFYTLLITGSYANSKETKNSDLDIIIVVNSDPKKTIANLKQYCELSIPQIHLHVFTAEEFKEMLLDKKSNYGKEAVKNNLIFNGAETYFKILLEATENGFSY